MVFEPTISIGNIITIAFALVTVVGAWYGFKTHLDVIEYRVGAIEKTMETLVDVLKSMAESDKQIALIDQRLTAIELTSATISKELSDLRRGVGWIQGDRRSNVDGEYKRE